MVFLTRISNHRLLRLLGLFCQLISRITQTLQVAMLLLASGWGLLPTHYDCITLYQASFASKLCIDALLHDITHQQRVHLGTDTDKVHRIAK